jgi:hypothetical protein
MWATRRWMSAMEAFPRRWVAQLTARRTQTSRRSPSSARTVNRVGRRRTGEHGTCAGRGLGRGALRASNPSWRDQRCGAFGCAEGRRGLPALRGLNGRKAPSRSPRCALAKHLRTLRRTLLRRRAAGRTSAWFTPFICQRQASLGRPVYQSNASTPRLGRPPSRFRSVSAFQGWGTPAQA